ncbi:MAG: endonuclease domain-containing protein [Rhizobiales bacterium]|nr:endonuclease domain-containing protein [Hyphomicrobiales bacterium]
MTPSPASRHRRSAPSPLRGEGREPVAVARRLRANMTDAERKLWFALRDRRLGSFKFKRQVPIGSFIVDFVCHDAGLIVEVDGGQHADSAADIRRQSWLEAQGFHILRFWNNEVLSNLNGVLQTLLAALNEANAMRLAAKPSPVTGEGGRERSKRPGEGHSR